MADTMAPQAAFRQHDFQPPQATISFPETSLSQSTSRAQSPLVKDEPTEEKKPAKKRKSWGQELPTPKTNLPPRKRAKTEDEKEQRRIERVLRNRAAAQSSRERKRQEVEKLEGEKSTIEQQNQWLKDRLMQVEHEKFLLGQQLRHAENQLKNLRQGSTSSDSSDDVELEEAFDPIKVKQEIEDHTSPFTSSPSFSSPSSMTYSPSVSPSQPSLSFDDSSLATSPDLTQHPAVSISGRSALKDGFSLSGFESLSGNNVDPIIFGDDTPDFDNLSPSGLDSLFASGDVFLPFSYEPTKENNVSAVPSSTTLNGNQSATAPQFTGTFTSEPDFAFDSLVDLDIVEDSTSAAPNTSTFQNEDLFQAPEPQISTDNSVNMDDSLSTATITSPASAQQSSAL